MTATGGLEGEEIYLALWLSHNSLARQQGKMPLLAALWASMKRSAAS
jgi:hypothetical protein